MRFLKIVILSVFVVAFFFFTAVPFDGVMANEFNAAENIRKNCSSLSFFAKKAVKDRRRIPLQDALPYYFKAAQNNLERAGRTPILTDNDKRIITDIMRFMWEDKSRTVSDYKRSCLAGDKTASPPWYREYVKENGVPQQVTAWLNGI